MRVKRAAITANSASRLSSGVLQYTLISASRRSVGDPLATASRTRSSAAAMSAAD